MALAVAVVMRNGARPTTPGRQTSIKHGSAGASGFASVQQRFPQAQLRWRGFRCCLEAASAQRFQREPVSTDAASTGASSGSTSTTGSGAASTAAGASSLATTGTGVTLGNSAADGAGSRTSADRQYPPS